MVRSTMPLVSGSRGGASTIRVPRVPANAAAGGEGRPLPPIADSRSHHRVFVTAPREWMIDHMPARMSPAVREGIIWAAITFENASVITSTGSIATWPPPTGIRGSGNHRSHCVVCPG